MTAITAFPHERPRLFLALAIVLWFLAYQALAPLAASVVSHLPIEPGSRLAESVQFFLYDAPKVLLLLTGVVMVMGMINSYFTAERTRVLLAGRAEGGADVTVEKVEDLQEIMRHGVMSTPGVVIDGKVVHSGGVPTRAKVESWMA